MVLVRSLVLMAGFGMVVAACGVPDPTGDGAVPPAPATSIPVDPTGVSPKDRAAPDLAAACGAVPLHWPIGDLDAAFDPFDGDIEELVDDAARFRDRGVLALRQGGGDERIRYDAATPGTPATKQPSLA